MMNWIDLKSLFCAKKYFGHGKNSLMDIELDKESLRDGDLTAKR